MLLRSETFLWRLVQEKYVLFSALSFHLLRGIQDEPARFVFFVSKLDVETLDIELLLYHIFKVQSSIDFPSVAGC